VPVLNHINAILQRHSIETAYREHIAADAVILAAASQFGGQHRPPVPGFVGVAHAEEPSVHLLALRAKLLAARAASDYETVPAAFSREMGKSLKVEGIGSASLPLYIRSFISAEAYHTRFLWM